MRLLIIAAVFLAGPAAATEVYRWIDANGQAHYSDQWRPGAERIRIEEAPGFSAPRPARDSTAAPGTQQSAVPNADRYKLLEISSPAQEEVLWNIEGQLRVAVRVSPSLRPGHGLRLYLDGKRQEVPPGSTETQLQEVYRGVHTLKAEVANESGTVLIESQPITFAVRQTSIANPSRPNP